tara:strand:- start:55 stop:306 length:252 start_codon:yes stop_codon:yes gene_type:complete
MTNLNQISASTISEETIENYLSPVLYDIDQPFSDTVQSFSSTTFTLLRQYNILVQDLENMRSFIKEQIGDDFNSIKALTGTTR